MKEQNRIWKKLPPSAFSHVSNTSMFDEDRYMKPLVSAHAALGAPCVYCSYVVMTTCEWCPQGLLAAVPPLGDTLRALGDLCGSHLP